MSALRSRSGRGSGAPTAVRAGTRRAASGSTTACASQTGGRWRRHFLRTFQALPPRLRPSCGEAGTAAPPGGRTEGRGQWSDIRLGCRGLPDFLLLLPQASLPTSPLRPPPAPRPPNRSPLPGWSLHPHCRPCRPPCASRAGAPPATRRWSSVRPPLTKGRLDAWPVIWSGGGTAAQVGAEDNLHVSLYPNILMMAFFWRRCNCI